MRKPRDFDSEMKTLNERAKMLKERKLHQLGELVTATGVDVLPIDVLAGALLMAVDTKDSATVEGWRKRGAAFFQSAMRSAARRNRSDARGAPARDGGTKPAAGDASAISHTGLASEAPRTDAPAHRTRWPRSQGRSGCAHR
jgi:hypothetical protein